MHVRMPLFTVISGFVYAMRPLGSGDPLRFMRGKARRLLIPLLTAVTITLVLGNLTHSSALAVPWAEAYKAYLFRYTHFWFLQAIFLVFALVTWLEHRSWLQTLRGWAIALIITALAKFVVPASQFFSIDGALYLCPLFILGLGLRRFQTELAAPKVFWPVLGVATGALAMQQLAMQSQLDVDIGKMSLLGTVTGLATAYLLVNLRVAWAPLGWIGAFSYTVYLYHHLGISVAERIYVWAGLPYFDGLFICKLLGGLAAGLLVETIAKRIPLLSITMLGLRPKRVPAPEPVAATAVATSSPATEAQTSRASGAS